MYNCPDCNKEMVKKQEPIVNVQQEANPEIVKLQGEIKALINGTDQTIATQERIATLTDRVEALQKAVYPYRIACLVSDVYSCEKCRVTLVKTNTEDYYPTTTE